MIPHRQTHSLRTTFTLLSVMSFATPLHASLTPGDILVDYFMDAQGSDNTNIHQYSPTGALNQIYSAPNMSQFRGLSLTPAGNIVTTYQSSTTGFITFAPDGSLLSDATTPQISNQSAPGTPTVFADGTVAIPDQGTPPATFPSDPPSIRFFSPDGTLLHTVSSPSLSDPLVTLRAPDNTMWIVNYMAGPIVHMNEDGTVLGTVPLSFQPVALALDPNNGTFWLSSYDGRIHHVDAAGNDLGSFLPPLQTLPPPLGWFHPASVPSGLAFANDGTLYIVGTFDPNLYHYTTTGTLLNSFPIDPPGWAFTLAIVPDPSLPGDANLDGKIDLSDLSIVLNNFGQSTTAWTAGNFDHTTTIDLTDLSDVLNNIGSSAPSPAIPVPESSCLPLLALGYLTHRRRKERRPALD